MRTTTTLLAVAAVCLSMVTLGAGSAAAATVSHDPVGHFDKASYNTKDNTLQVGGWAADPDLGSTAGQRVMISIDGVDVKSLATGSPRPDVGRIYPRYGGKTGFSRALAVPKDRGKHTVCARAINRGAGNKVSVSLGCKAFTVKVPGAIIGHIDKAQFVNNRLEVAVSGWVLNPYDTMTPTPFFATGPNGYCCDSNIRYENYTVAAPESRPDVDRQFPRNGSRHGFHTTFDAASLANTGAFKVICLARVPGYYVGTGEQDAGVLYPSGVPETTKFCATIQPGVIDPP